MGVVVPTFTDYAIPCGDLPESFLKMLANCIITYNGHQHLNLIYNTGYCSDMTDYWTCSNNGDMSPQFIETTLVANLFALDECGRLGLKVIANLGEE